MNAYNKLNRNTSNKNILRPNILTKKCQVLIRRDDGIESLLPMQHFFRTPAEFSPIENVAHRLCKGRVLDVGAGSGLHSLALQANDLSVTAIDLCSQTVEIMSCRGVENVLCVDIFDFAAGPFDTLLMLGHGIGLVETLAGLDRFLIHARQLLSDSGQVLFDSLDVRKTEDPVHLAYQEANRKAGRYIGEIRLQFAYSGKIGPKSGWLHIDVETMTECAEEAGWHFEVIHQQESGEYLGRLTSSKT